MSRKRNNSILLTELLIIAGAVIAPYTLLRFSFFGLAEVSFILLFLHSILQPLPKKILSFRFLTFWILYLFTSILGFLYNFYALDMKTGTFGGMLFDFASFLMVLFACFSLEVLIYKQKINTYRILKMIFILSSTSMLALYILSFFTNSIFGLPLKYYDYFVPLAKNLHQISMTLVVLPFIGLKVLLTDKNFLVKIFAIFLVVMDIIMAFDTGSAKAYLSVYFGLYLFSIILIYNRVKNVKVRSIIIVFLIMMLTVFVYSFRVELSEYAINYFQEEDTHDSRSFMYSDAIITGLDSPLIGLGTGPHILISNKFWDVHQSFLAAFLHAGIIGFFLLVYLFIRLLIKTMHQPALFGGVIAILMYALGGDIQRRLPIWIFLVLFFYYKQSDENIVTGKTYET